MLLIRLSFDKVGWIFSQTVKTVCLCTDDKVDVTRYNQENIVQKSDLVNVLDLSRLVQLHRGGNLERRESPGQTETPLGLLHAQGLLSDLLQDTPLHGLLARVGITRAHVSRICPGEILKSRKVLHLRSSNFPQEFYGQWKI